MGKPVAGEVVVLPFPQTDLRAGKRRPALVVADAGGDDVVLCQITSQTRNDLFAVHLAATDFDRGQLSSNSYVRANRLFTVDHAAIIYTVGSLKPGKMNEVKAKVRQLFA